jgi:hypothetical protein
VQGGHGEVEGGEGPDGLHVRGGAGRRHGGNECCLSINILCIREKKRIFSVNRTRIRFVGARYKGTENRAYDCRASREDSLRAIGGEGE